MWGEGGGGGLALLDLGVGKATTFLPDAGGRRSSWGAKEVEVLESLLHLWLL